MRALSAREVQEVVGCSAALALRYTPLLNPALVEFAIDTRDRHIAFLAQVGHETESFRYMEEIWGPTDQQKKYEPPNPLALRLGNTEPGDGKRFKGHGPIQITGRTNHVLCGRALGFDGAVNPRTILDDANLFRSAAWYWTTFRNLNPLADLATIEAFRDITRKINGGQNGAPDREARRAMASLVLRVEMYA